MLPHTGAPARGIHLTNGDRLFLVQLYRWFPSVLKAITLIRPEPRALASRRLPPVLALEIPFSRRQPEIAADAR
jgi:hypothetical protein